MLCLLLVASAPAGLALETSPTEERHEYTQESSIDARYVVDRLPDRTGLVRVSTTIEVPQHVSGLSIKPPSKAAVESADGLDRDGEEWHINDDTDTATITYTVPIGLETTFGQRTADTAEWTLIARQEIALRARWQWRFGARPSWNESLAIGPGQSGVTGTTAMYIGPHETATRTVDGDRITMVVPAAAELRPDRTAVLDTLSHAKRSSKAGPDHSEIVVFVAPNDLAPGGFTPSNGEPDVIVSAGEPVAAPINVWAHEYRHTRQAYDTSAEMDWLDEGSADYYTARLTYAEGSISAAQYRNRVTSERHETADLTRPASWSGPGAQYDKGSRVVAALDARIRLETDDRRSFEDVLDRLVNGEDTVTLDRFVATVSAVAGEDLDSYVREIVTGPAPPVTAVDVAADGPVRTGVADTTPRNPNAAPLDDEAGEAAGQATSQSDLATGTSSSEQPALPGPTLGIGSLLIVLLVLQRHQR